MGPELRLHPTLGGSTFIPRLRQRNRKLAGERIRTPRWSHCSGALPDGVMLELLEKASGEASLICRVRDLMPDR